MKKFIHAAIAAIAVFAVVGQASAAIGPKTPNETRWEIAAQAHVDRDTYVALRAKTKYPLYNGYLMDVLRCKQDVILTAKFRTSGLPDRTGVRCGFRIPQGANKTALPGVVYYTWNRTTRTLTPGTGFAEYPVHQLPATGLVRTRSTVNYAANQLRENARVENLGQLIYRTSCRRSTNPRVPYCQFTSSSGARYGLFVGVTTDGVLAGNIHPFAHTQKHLG